ncbi:MAG: ATP-binding protein [Mycobacterium sp.]|nr:ATP-binding protein [Mycobacterium sp.]
MTTPCLPCRDADADADRFTRSDAAADGPTAARIREDFAHWLRRDTAFAETRICDVVLAVNEALANAAEFAYRRGPAGNVGITAVRNDGSGALTVTITDQGLWREVDPLRRRRSRGRGIPLMRTLADEVVIDTTAPGTRVCLRFFDRALSEEAGTPLLA